MLGGQGAHTDVILVVHECIWNAPTVSLVLLAFDNTDSLGSLPCQVFYPCGSTLGDCLLFLLFCFPVFPLLLTFECCLLGLLLINNQKLVLPLNFLICYKRYFFKMANLLLLLPLLHYHYSLHNVLLKGYLPHEPLPYTPITIMHNSPCLSYIQTSLLQAILHVINPPLPQPTQ